MPNAAATRTVRFWPLDGGIVAIMSDTPDAARHSIEF